MKHYSEAPIRVPRFNEGNGFYTTPERSKLMGKVKGVDNKAEVKLRKALWNLGYRYRKHVKKLPGKPDIVFSKYRLVIFIDGEFWHGYKWEEKREKIKSNRDFWIPKIERNMQRDVENNSQLQAAGWEVQRFWEKEVQKSLDVCLEKIVGFIKSKEKEGLSP